MVVNPTQYLNAVEYAYQSSGFEDHIVIMTFYPKSIAAIDDLGAEKFWSSREILDFSRVKGLDNDRKFWTMCKSLLEKAFDRIGPSELVVGNLIDGLIYPFYLSKRRLLKTVVNLDDGTPTLKIVKHRRDSGFYRAYHFQSLKSSFKKLLYLKMIPTLIKPPAGIQFFSMFKLDLPQGDFQRINEYSWTRSKVKDIANTNQALFVGSHLVDRGIVTEQAYLDSIDFIRTTLEREGYEFLYVHHRGESADIKNKVQAMCQTIEFTRPLELEFLEKSRPAIFAGHFSSALFTLSRIYPATEVKAYLFDNKEIIGSSFEPREYIGLVQDTLNLDPIVNTIVLPVKKEYVH